MEPDVIGLTGASKLGFSTADLSRIIEMAWDDHTSFEAIRNQFGLGEAGVVRLMRSNLKRGSFQAWRKRVRGRLAKHGNLQFARGCGGVVVGGALEDALAEPMADSLAEPFQQSNFF